MTCVQSAKEKETITTMRCCASVSQDNTPGMEKTLPSDPLPLDLMGLPTIQDLDLGVEVVVSGLVVVVGGLGVDVADVVAPEADVEVVPDATAIKKKLTRRLNSQLKPRQKSQLDLHFCTTWEKCWLHFWLLLGLRFTLMLTMNLVRVSLRCLKL